MINECQNESEFNSLRAIGSEVGNYKITTVHQTLRYDNKIYKNGRNFWDEIMIYQNYIKQFKFHKNKEEVLKVIK